jgi:hypothetical protein
MIIVNFPSEIVKIEASYDHTHTHRRGSVDGNRKSCNKKAAKTKTSIQSKGQ